MESSENVIKTIDFNLKRGLIGGAFAVARIMVLQRMGYLLFGEYFSMKDMHQETLFLDVLLEHGLINEQEYDGLSELLRIGSHVTNYSRLYQRKESIPNNQLREIENACNSAKEFLKRTEVLIASEITPIEEGAKP